MIGIIQTILPYHFSPCLYTFPIFFQTLYHTFHLKFLLLETRDYSYKQTSTEQHLHRIQFMLTYYSEPGACFWVWLIYTVWPHLKTWLFSPSSYLWQTNFWLGVSVQVLCMLSQSLLCCGFSFTEADSSPQAHSGVKVFFFFHTVPLIFFCVFLFCLKPISVWLFIFRNMLMFPMLKNNQCLEDALNRI